MAETTDFDAQLSNTPATVLITAGAGGDRLKQIIAVNETGSAHTVTVDYIRSGDTAGGPYSKNFANALALAANEAKVLFDARLQSEYNEFLMYAGDTLTGSADAGSAVRLLVTHFA